MPDSWLSKYQNALQICREAAESINDTKIELRNNGQRKTSSSVNDTNEHIKKDILNVSSLAENLKIELWDPKLISSKTQGEIERRQNLLDSLMMKIQILNEAFNHGRKFDNSERLELLSSSSGSGEMANNQWLEGDEVKSALQSSQQFHQKRVQVYEEQEEGLHVLANSLNRQKQIGINIGKQTDYHSEIIDEINERAVSSDNQLRHLTTRMQQVSANRKKSTFVLWVMVILLAIALVVLALIPL